ncbi:MAG: glycosyltransferase family 4 protein [Flavobacteriales bacterium]|nr:glycosyltransferase family 4 protein [Flavobacteriales bacterium]
MDKKTNIYCENYGWLFEDLKLHFSKLRLSGISVICTDKPIIEADAWVAIRTVECKLSPKPAKTVVCTHDLKHQSGLYSPDGPRGAVHQMKALVMCHPEQRNILSEAAYSFAGHPILERPLGALKTFSPAYREKPRFTIGWVGKDHPGKRLDWLISAINCMEYSKNQLEIMLVGMDLERTQKEIIDMGITCRWYNRNNTPIEAYPDLYRQMNCLVISGRLEAGPLTLFEALASGIPVISTPVGWASWFAERAPQFVKIASSPEEIAKELEQFFQQKSKLETDRDLIAKFGSIWRLDDWFKEVVELASSLITETVVPNSDLTSVHQ